MDRCGRSTCWIRWWVITSVIFTDGRKYGFTSEDEVSRMSGGKLVLRGVGVGMSPRWEEERDVVRGLGRSRILVFRTGVSRSCSRAGGESSAISSMSESIATFVGLNPGDAGIPGERRCGVGNGWCCSCVGREETERGGWVIIGGRSLCAGRWEDAMIVNLGSGDETERGCCPRVESGCAMGPNPKPWSPS